MTALRRLAGSSASWFPHRLPCLRSVVASTLLARQHSTEDGAPAAKICSTSEAARLRQAPMPGSSWRCFDSRAVAISLDAIPQHAWIILKKLRKEGFDAYLVGGCVRDLLLNRAPKDFDVITTASLKQIKNMMKHCVIIGRHFPICQIKIHGSTIEVSSFSTNAIPVNRSKEVDSLEELNNYNDGNILHINSMKRDFTINSLFFDPLKRRIFDCVSGLSDLRKNKVCTVISAHVSFKEDPARILRGMRVAGRLDFQFSGEAFRAIQDLSSLIMAIPKARLMIEMNYMLSYGAAERTFRLLRKYGLLDILLPFQAAYLSDQMKGRSSDNDLMLMKLLANLDKLLSANRPCHRSLWLALLAFHSALISSPQDAQVIRAFAALLHFGSWESTMYFLEQDIGCHAPFVPEIIGSSQTKLDSNLMEQTSHLASLVNSSICTLTSLDNLQQSVAARYGEASQFSGVVFVSRTEGRRLLKLFEGLDSDLTWLNRVRRSPKIHYGRLKDGVPAEVRFVLGKVILDTMNDELPRASSEDAVVTGRSFGNVATSPAVDIVSIVRPV